MSKGFGGVPGNLQGLMKQAQKMQEQLQKTQEEIENYSAEGQSGGGMVRATANGKNKLLSISIDSEVVNPDDVEMLQDLVLAAVNNALSKVQEHVKEEMGKVTGGMSVPGLF